MSDIADVTKSLRSIDWGSAEDRLSAIMKKVNERAAYWRALAETCPCPSLENRALAEQHFLEDCERLAGVDLDDDGYPDDVVFEDVESVHIERMNNGHVWMGVYKNDGTRYMCNFSTPRNGRLNWIVEED